MAIRELMALWRGLSFRGWPQSRLCSRTVSIAELDTPSRDEAAGKIAISSTNLRLSSNMAFPKASKIARDPLTHFLLLGVMFFLVSLLWERYHDPRAIVINAGIVRSITADYERRFGFSPSNAELKNAVASYAEDEALYREGQALGLDRDDEIVRRRIIQKMRFLQQTAISSARPSQSELRDYYARHRQDYVRPVTISFHHIYFSTDDGDHTAFVRAMRMRRALAGKVTVLGEGDPFPDRTVFTGMTIDDVRRVFGRSPFVHAAFSVPAGKWSAPVRSGWGWHLIFVDRRDPAMLRPFEQVRDTVSDDWVRTEWEGRENQITKKLMARYTVIEHAL